MLFRRKSKSAIDRKLSDLEKEMARINREIRAASRTPALKAFDKSKLNKREPREISGAGPKHSSSPPDTRRDAAAVPAELRKTKQKKTGIRQHEPVMDDNREKFVSYFATEHTNEFRPRRQDGEVFRNKAIMMAILAALAAFGLLFHFFGR